tara:strand:+ start:4532 stop:4885 length:354 start_codon:yes stop_codon:yes gene_type:complete
LQSQLVVLQLAELAFVGTDHRWIAGVHDSDEQGFHLFFKRLKLTLARCRDLVGLRETLTPGVSEHDLHQIKKGLTGLKGFDHVAHIAFEPISGDGFAVAGASPVLTEVVGVALGVAL